MDFTNRGPQPQPIHQNPQSNATPTASAKRRAEKNNLIKWITTTFGAIVIVLIIAVVAAVSFGGPKSESGYVYSNKLQAVFLNTGQVYFGNVKNINPQYLVLDNIFYLQTSKSSSTATTASTANTNVSLVKLGCELHAPYDQMVINMTQVTFWENLQSSGQVAKAVAQYQKQYPHGQTCSAQSNNTSPVTSSVQNAPTSSVPTTTKKP